VARDFLRALPRAKSTKNGALPLRMIAPPRRDVLGVTDAPAVEQYRSNRRLRHRIARGRTIVVQVEERARQRIPAKRGQIVKMAKQMADGNAE
jgi:hypothetical protein